MSEEVELPTRAKPDARYDWLDKFKSWKCPKCHSTDTELVGDSSLCKRCGFFAKTNEWSRLKLQTAQQSHERLFQAISEAKRDYMAEYMQNYRKTHPAYNRREKERKRRKRTSVKSDFFVEAESGQYVTL